MQQEISSEGRDLNPTLSYCFRMITGAQCRMARAALRMTQKALADRSGVSVLSIKRFEAGSDPRLSLANRIERALVAAGITLIDDGAASPAGLGLGIRLTERRQGASDDE